MISETKLINRLHKLEDICLKEKYTEMLKPIHDLMDDIKRGKLQIGHLDVEKYYRD